MFIEAVIGAVLALLVLAVLAALRRERRHPGTTHPLVLGIYRGLAVVLVLYVAWVVFSIALGPRGGVR